MKRRKLIRTSEGKEKKPSWSYGDREYLSGNDVIIPKNNFKEAITGAQSILHIVIGLLLGAALVYFIVTPARMSHLTDQVTM